MKTPCAEWCEVPQLVGQLDHRLVNRHKPGVLHARPEVVDSWVAGQIRGNGLGKIDGQGLPMADDPLRIGHGADLSAGPQHANRFSKELVSVVDVVDHVHGENEIELAGREVQGLRLPARELNFPRSARGLRQHLWRRINSPARAATGLPDREDVVPRAAADFEDLVRGAQALGQAPQRLRMDAPVLRVRGRELVVVDHNSHDGEERIVSPPPRSRPLQRPAEPPRAAAFLFPRRIFVLDDGPWDSGRSGVGHA